MNVTKNSATKQRPKVIPSIVAGFDTITNHIYLILFPVAFDLLLWLGPHLRIKPIVENFINNLADLPELNTPQFSEMLAQSLDAWELIGERLNILIAIRSFPVGIPALFVSSLPIEAPFIEPKMLDISNFFVLLGLIALFMLVGVLLGSVYFSLVSNASLEKNIKLRYWLMDIPLLGIQSLGVTFVWLFILIVVSIPVMCISSVAILLGPSIGQIALLLYIGILVWIFFPLIFSTHGIYVFRQRVWPSIRDGARLTNLTLPTTGPFILLAILISQVMDFIWRIPPEGSLLALIGVFGHGFIVTGLLSASFIYYQQAKNWVDEVLTDKNIQKEIVHGGGNPG